jgi:hypothetical protein
MSITTTVAEKDDAKLAAKIVVAIKELDAAEIAKKEKQIIAGRLLAEAQKRHPSDKAFEKFLVAAGGIQIRRARDLIAIALGRKDFEQHQEENAEAQQRHRDKLKAEKFKREKADAEARGRMKPKPEPEQEPEPVAALRNAEPEPAPQLEPKLNAISANNLREFEFACRTYLPRLDKADLKKAVHYVVTNGWCVKTKKKESA